MDYLQGAKSNKKKATKLAQEVCNSIKQILQVYPAGSSFFSSSTPDLHEDGVREFQRYRRPFQYFKLTAHRALEDVAAFVERIAQRNKLWRFLNQQEDRQELSEYRMKITEAKLQFLVSLPSQYFPPSKIIQVAIEMAKTQIRQREQQYSVFALADLELRQELNQTNPTHTRAVARLVSHQKLVLLRRYQEKSVSHE